MNQPVRPYTIEHTQTHIHVEFSLPHLVLSSAVLNGGLVHASHIVNLKVEINQPEKLLVEAVLP